jgi:peptide/nickel transport system substrate-binding protein
VLGIGGQDTDPEQARALLEEANATGYEIKFFYSTDDPLSVAAKDQIVKGLEAAASPPRRSPHDGEDPRGADRLRRPVNVRSSGWCSDWPTGGSWFPAQWDGSLVGLEGMPTWPTSRRATPTTCRRRSSTVRRRGAAGWNELDKLIEEKYYPAVNTGYAGTAIIRGSKIGGMYNDNVRGMPTFQTMYVTQ